MNSSPHRTTWADWAEWKKFCAVDLCSEDVRDRLVSFVGPQLINKFRRAHPDKPFPTLSSGKESNPARMAFHHFETYMHTGPQSTGKRWKDWLFQRAALNRDDPPAVAIEKLVSNCLRTAVLRMILEDEPNAGKGNGQNVSLDEKVGPDSDQTRENTIQDHSVLEPDQEAELRELAEIGKNEALQYFETMDWAVKVAMLATVLGVSLAHPIVTKAAGKSKASLYALLNLDKQTQIELKRKCCTRIWLDFRQDIEKRWPEEDARTLNLLADYFMEALAERVREWGGLENSLAPLFSLQDEVSMP